MKDKIKTTRQIVFKEIKDYFPDDERWDTEEWIKMSDLKEIIVPMGYQGKSLINLYDKLFHTPTIDGEQINKTGGQPNSNKENNLECSPKRL